MTNKLLKEILQSWRWRIKKQGLTIKQFCELAEINRDYFYNLKNPTIKIVDDIEMKLRELEAKNAEISQ